MIQLVNDSVKTRVQNREIILYYCNSLLQLLFLISGGESDFFLNLLITRNGALGCFFNYPLVPRKVGRPYHQIFKPTCDGSPLEDFTYPPLEYISRVLHVQVARSTAPVISREDSLAAGLLSKKFSRDHLEMYTSAKTCQQSTCVICLVPN